MTQPRVVTLGVEDLARSRQFYSRGLGWTPLLDLDEIVFYQWGPGFVLAVWTRSELEKDIGRPIRRGGAFSLGHNVASPAEVSELVERARAAGATVVKEPQEAPLFGGHQGCFLDPDGHLWDVVYNPGLTVGDDGAVAFE
jgi:catechol 2,3-dioxygenase-like lactoylglutathione lyase family enzyme